MSRSTTFVRAAFAVVLMLCASAGYAQRSSYEISGQTLQPYNNSFSSINQYTPSPARGKMYVACWAEVSSRGTAYFSSTFAAPVMSAARKEFRELVTTQYGPVSQLRCAGKFSEAVVMDMVGQWKDEARTANNAVVDTGWNP
jgi:hypothetical protein